MKKIFIRLLARVVNVSNHTKCVSLSNQKFKIQPTLINLHPNEYTQVLHHFSFVVNLDRCVGKCNILNALSNKVCVPNKTEDLNLSVLIMITGIKKPETLTTKHISCERRCKFDARKYNSNQKWNNDKCWCECKKRHICVKDYIWNPATCNCEIAKYLANIIDDLGITCDEIRDAQKTKMKQQILMKKNAICKAKNLYVWLVFFLISIAFLIAVSFYCYLIKYQVKQKHLLPFHITNDKLINDKLTNAL